MKGSIRFRSGRDTYLVTPIGGFPRHAERLSLGEAASVLRELEASRRVDVLRQLQEAIGPTSYGQASGFSAEPLLRELRRGATSRVGMFREHRPWLLLNVDLPVVDLVDLVETERPTEPPASVFFSVRVIDEVGDPVGNLGLSFDVYGKTHQLVTDGSGVARHDQIQSGGTARVRIRDLKALREALAPRWQEPREPNIPASTDEQPVHVEMLDDEFDPIVLRSGRIETLVIVPRFRCREVPATTFDFARSFVKQTGIPALATIAEELHQDDSQQAMIFGHTDTSGTELLNKRLSERRGKVVFALLTHDFDAWQEMWKAKISEYPWWERWGTRESQHMLNGLECRDDDGEPLDEDGDTGSRTRQACQRFQRGDYPRKPDEQADLEPNGKFDDATLRELFFAYAKLVTREPVDPARITNVGGSPFMGCGEFNPLSIAAKDQESRRTVVYVFDPAAAPTGAPCQIGDVGPCRDQLVDPPPDPKGEGPFYRCEFYRKLATCCPSVGGADLSRDVIVRFFMSLDEANTLPHQFVLEAEDQHEDDDDTPVFQRTATLSSEARALVAEEKPTEESAEMVELHFTHVPDAHAYRLRADGTDSPHAIFTGVRFHGISELSVQLTPPRCPSLLPILFPKPPNPAPAPNPSPTPTPNPNVP